MKHEGCENSLTAVTSPENHASYDQLDCRGYDGVIGFNKRSFSERQIPIVVEMALRRIFVADLLFVRRRSKGEEGRESLKRGIQ
jgi:hypothetical protein